MSRVFQVPHGNEIDEPEPLACISANGRRVCSPDSYGTNASIEMRSFQATSSELSALQLDIFENDNLLQAFSGCTEPCSDSNECSVCPRFEESGFEHPISAVVDVRPPLRRTRTIVVDHFEIVTTP